VIVCGTAVIAGECPYGTPATPQSAVGEEIDIFSFLGSTMVCKQGLRIYDLGPVDARGAGTLSAAINIGKGGTAAVGWVNGILFGDPNVGDNNFPVPSGALIKASTTGTALSDGVDFSGMVGFTGCAFKSPGGFCVNGSGSIAAPATATGTPVASLCLDAAGNIIRKTTPGSCI
jgi:hypothetical protein